MRCDNCGGAFNSYEHQARLDGGRLVPFVELLIFYTRGRGKAIANHYISIDPSPPTTRVLPDLPTKEDCPACVWWFKMR